MKSQKLNWEKSDGLIPAVIQDATDGTVLMLGYMNRAAYQQTLDSGRVCFWSRSRQKLWTKGETSGNWLQVRAVEPDCDGDSLLIRAEPAGPTCHLGNRSCFAGESGPAAGFLFDLENLIASRRRQMPDDSYTTSLLRAGLPAIARKVGEEAVEVVVSAQEEPARSVEEAADLLYHVLVFLSARDLKLREVIQELERRAI